VRFASHSIEDDAGHLDVVAMAGEPLDQGGRRSGHAARVDHQDHRQVEQAREIGGGPVSVGRAVE
jgi:hypothetical protein